MPNKIVQKIKDLRKTKKLTQEDMAKILGYTSAKGYHDIESGRIKLKIEHLQKISNEFHIPIEKFFE